MIPLIIDVGEFIINQNEAPCLPGAGIAGVKENKDVAAGISERVLNSASSLFQAKSWGETTKGKRMGLGN